MVSGGICCESEVTTLSEVTVVRVTEDNYHLFADMVFWRQQGRERTVEEKQVSASMEYKDAGKALDSGHLFVFAAQCAGRFVGWISIVFMPKVSRWTHGVLYIDELWTAAEHRRRGVASRLLECVDALGEQTEADAVRLYVGTDNADARSLYERHGFVIQGEAFFMERSGETRR